jgi:hypothetical protein
LPSLSPQSVLGLFGLALFTALFLGARLVAKSPFAPRAGVPALVVMPVALVASVASLNYVVNPFGLFDVELFEPIVLHSRAAKVKLYTGRRPPPEVVVFGSSPSFTMEPSYIQARTGKPAFNASVHGGTPRDFLAFTRLMLQRRHVPRLAIVALRMEQFRPDTRVGFEPGDPLGPYVREDPAPLETAVEEAETLLTLEQTEASVRLLSVELRGRPQPHYRFDADGLGHFSPSSLDDNVDAFLAEAAKPHHLRFEELSRTQIGHLEQFLRLCRENGTRVVAYVPPYHPRLLDLWTRQTRLPELRADLLEELARWQGPGGVTVHDLTRVESFGGTDRMFIDALHPNEEANRRILDVLLEDVS